MAGESPRLSGTMIAAPQLILSSPDVATHSVMAGLVPAIHVLLRYKSQTWMAVTSTAMTACAADASAHDSDCQRAIIVPDNRGESPAMTVVNGRQRPDDQPRVSPYFGSSLV
jgi:hypothetical protein